MSNEMEKHSNYDLVIIGSGPAGYVAAIRAGQVGLKTAIIEKSFTGGMCLNWGCIPTKTLLESAKRMEAVRGAADFGIDGIDTSGLVFNWKKALKRSGRIVKRLTKGIEFLLKKNGVELIGGEGEIVSATSVSVANRLLETKNILVATGSYPAPLPFDIRSEKVLEIRDFLALEELPGKPLIYGNGPHAVELAQFFNLIGIDVKLLVPGEALLPGLDPHLADYMKGRFKKSKIDILFASKVEAKGAEGLVADGVEVEYDVIINGAARKAVIPRSKISFELDNGFLKVNDYLQTEYESVYGVGDVNGLSYFAHAASAQGLHAINVMSGVRKPFSLRGLPMSMYTSPEMAQVGLTEPEVKAGGGEYRVNEFPLSANGKALAEGNTEGFVRILSEPKYGEVLGVQIVAPHATDMIAEAALTMQLEGRVFDVANTIHAHPTVSEVFMEAGFAAFDRPIHQ